MSGFLGDVVEFTRAVVSGAQAPEVRVDRGGDDAVTGGHFSAPGDDSQPLPGDVAYMGDDDGAGNAQALGYQDPKTAPKAALGEKRIYARSGAGTACCEVWLKADGSVLVRNDAGSLELAPDGAATLANDQGSIELDAAGKVTVITPLGSFGADSHTHTTPFGPSGPPMPGT
jgi:hypothetical protein